MTFRIPLARPEITDADREAVMGVLRTSDLSMGPKLHEFQQAFCDYTGSRFAVAMNSGTSALHLAVRALSLSRGDEVILPSFTFSALLNVLLQEGLVPKFVDIEGAMFNTTPEKIAAAIGPRTRLVLAVHTFGFPVNVPAIRAVTEERRDAGKNEIALIEDACEALGAEIQGRKVGSFGDAGLFAFYPNKQITTGEGGVLVTSNQALATTIATLRNQGRDPALNWNQHAEIGFSYRISDLNCALGISQLSRIESVVARRQSLAEFYDSCLQAIPHVVRPPLRSKVGRISWFVYPIQLSEEFDSKGRDAVCQAMQRRGIATGRYFAPLHRQPVLAKSAISATRANLSHTEAVADRTVILPFFNELTTNQVQEVCGALEESIVELRRKT